MRENICTIPVNEVFEVRDGCPVCRMRAIIEAKYIDYITGAAMMEPDIRIMTNKSGFCERHYDQMLALGRQRLPICLMLETHIRHIQEDLLSAPDKSSIKKLGELEGDCFVCGAIETHLARALDTVYRSYKREPDFRALFDAQPQLCPAHYRRMMEEGKKTVGPMYRQFAEAAGRQAKSWCDAAVAGLGEPGGSVDDATAGASADGAVPVKDMYKVNDGCPVCRIRDRIEEEYKARLTGSGISGDTSAGFCERHYDRLTELSGQYAPVRRVMGEYIKHIRDDLLPAADKNAVKKLGEFEHSCRSCGAAEQRLAQALDAVYRGYRDDPEFRALFDAQTQLCLPHYRRMIADGKKPVGAMYKQFAQTANRQAKSLCDKIYRDMKGFEDAFDHRNAGKPMPEQSRDAIERAIRFVTSRDPKNGKRF